MAQAEAFIASCLSLSLCESRAHGVLVQARAPLRIAAACLRKVGLLPRLVTEATPADRLAAKERELDLPPLPDIPDDVPPDTDDV